jgi:hypothetical protein
MIGNSPSFDRRKRRQDAFTKKTEEENKRIEIKRREEKVEEYFLHVYPAALTTLSERR